MGQSSVDLRALQPGVIVEGKYRVDRVIGRGGMGIVVAATHVGLNEPVALKFLQVKESCDGESAEDFRARFAREARVCAKLRNEHIARVRDVGVWNGVMPFMVMELLEGLDLRRTLKTERKLPLLRAVDIAVQVCRGLAEAHAHGIVHRDLKPANIFLTQRADGVELVKVLDFGISKILEGDEEGELTKAGTMLGSPKYMSPEQLSGGAIDGRADVWSIGAILYEMLAGRPPYDYAQLQQTFIAIATGTPPPLPSTFEPSLPPAIDQAIFGCLTHDRDARTANVADLAGALLEAVGSPLAQRVRAQIGALLSPGSQELDTPSGARTSTTGTFGTFSLAGTTGPISISAPTPAPSTADLIAPPKSNRKRWVVAMAAAAACGALLVVEGLGARASATAGAQAVASATRGKVVAIKSLLAERTTSMRSSEPASDDDDAPARAVAPTVYRPRATATVTRTPPAAPPVVAAPAPKPAPAAPPKTAPAKPSSTPLDDRQ